MKYFHCDELTSGAACPLTRAVVDMSMRNMLHDVLLVFVSMIHCDLSFFRATNTHRVEIVDV